MNTVDDEIHHDNDNDNVNHYDIENENNHDNDNENHVNENHNNYGNMEIERIVVPESMFGTEFLNAQKHEFTYDNTAVDKINDSTSAQWKLDLNDLDWLSIKERGNDLYKQKAYKKARFAYLLASRKCNDDRNKAICLGNLSAVYYTQKHYKAVIKACDECLELNPGIFIFT
jgi:tetratricopeptide (TPR) repeat protein